METEFKNALDSAGLSTKDKIIADGKLHRFHVTGDKPGSKNGWYVFYSREVPAGAYGSWKSGVKGTWCIKNRNSMTTSEKQLFKQRMFQARKEREAEEQKRRNAARDKAQMLWEAAPYAPDTHPYLVMKGVKSHDLKAYNGALLLAMQDANDTIRSLQFIYADGTKRFLPGGRKTGCFFLIGDLTSKLLICEGYATGASLHEATGYGVAVAFDAGNLKPVARGLKAKYPQLELVICADNDLSTNGNPGVTKAREAALDVGGAIAIPPIDGDFNDLMQMEAEHVR